MTLRAARRGLHCDCTNWDLRRRSLLRPNKERKLASICTPLSFAEFVGGCENVSSAAAAPAVPPPDRKSASSNPQNAERGKQAKREGEREVAEMQQDFKPCSLSLSPLPMQAACVSLSPCCYLLPLLRVRDKSLFLGKHAVGRTTHSLARSATDGGVTYS